MKFVATLVLGFILGWSFCNINTVSAAARKSAKVANAVSSAATNAIKDNK